MSKTKRKILKRINYLQLENFHLKMEIQISKKIINAFKIHENIRVINELKKIIEQKK